MKVVIIISGGMDSTTLLYDILNKGYDVYALSFDYKQRHRKELEMARKTCEKLKVPHKIVDITSINQLLQGNSLTSDIDVPEGNYNEDSMKATVVPNRNMIFLSLAIGYAISVKAKKVYYGAHAGDHAIYPDCRKDFIEAMQKVASLCDYEKIMIEAPYIDIDKAEILKKGTALGVDYSLTWTCYKGKEKPCKKCGACNERKEAFDLNGKTDPLGFLYGM